MVQNPGIVLLAGFLATNLAVGGVAALSVLKAIEKSWEVAMIYTPAMVLALVAAETITGMWLYDFMIWGVVKSSLAGVTGASIGVLVIFVLFQPETGVEDSEADAKRHGGSGGDDDDSSQDPEEAVEQLLESVQSD